VLGQSAREDALAEVFKAAAPFNVVKGFAVGRTIFVPPARLWFAGRIDDAEAVERVAAGFKSLIEAWRAAKVEALTHMAAE
jgi:5-dehydro-2-deoxygluconokinase